MHTKCKLPRERMAASTKYLPAESFGFWPWCFKTDHYQVGPRHGDFTLALSILVRRPMCFEFPNQRTIMVQNEWRCSAFWALLCYGKLLLEASCPQPQPSPLRRRQQEYVRFYIVICHAPDTENSCAATNPNLEVISRQPSETAVLWPGKSTRTLQDGQNGKNSGPCYRFSVRTPPGPFALVRPMAAIYRQVCPLTTS